MTVDTLGRLVYRIGLNPLITLPLWLAGRYTGAGGTIASNNPSAFNWLRKFLILGALARATDFLNAGALNNWSNDTYDWNKEIVVVTGGSDGIGARIVKLLAEKGIKVAVVDVQGLKFEGASSCFSVFSQFL